MDAPMPSFPERRVNLSGELLAVREALDNLAEAVATSFDEDRMKEAFAEEQNRQRQLLLADHRRERNRLISFIVLGVVLLAAIGIAGGVQSRANHEVADQIRQCQTPGTRCATRAQQQFNAAVTAEYRAITCYVSYPIEQRTRAIADRCIEDALHDAGVTTTTMIRHGGSP
jgi:hypothetical protein